MNRAPEASIVAPTYREAGNVAVLVPRIAAAMNNAGIGFEIVVVDDNSRDGVDEVCQQLAGAYPLRLITRVDERGLATAVLCGMNAARGDVLVVMDADLSHPPEAVAELVRACQSPAVDFVIGSRYVAGGVVDAHWSLFRRLNSRAAGALARGLTAASDPMSGFFAIRRAKFLEAGELNPLGYKIGLELIVRCGCRRIAEVPIYFQDRKLGTSKLTLRQQWLYLRHLARLYHACYPTTVSAIRFGVVGATGAVVDMGSLALLLAAMPLAAARALSIGIAMNWNFLLHRRLTFRGGADQRRPLRQYAAFCGACGLGAAINWSVSLGAAAMLQGLGRRELLAAAIGVVAGAAANFAMCAGWVFRREPARNVQPADVRERRAA